MQFYLKIRRSANAKQILHQCLTHFCVQGKYGICSFFFDCDSQAKKQSGRAGFLHLRRFVHYFAGCRKDVPRHRQQPSLSRYMVFSCLLFISQINLGLRTVGSYNPPIVGAGYWISRYFLLKVPSLSGDEVQVVANISQRGLDLSLV